LTLSIPTLSAKAALGFSPVDLQSLSRLKNWPTVMERAVEGK
jgi:hypothetical protein